MLSVPHPRRGVSTLQVPFLHGRTPARLAVVALLVLPSVLHAQAPVERGEQENPIPVAEVVVTASGFEQARVNAPASVTVLTRDVIQLQRNGSLAELLMNVEGIDVGGSAGKTGGLSISMRGMPSDYTLVLVDGKRQNAAGNVTPNGFGETSTSFLPPLSAIERVEVIRGPMATLYGSDAMGGVVNIITRKVARAWSGSASLDATVQQESDFGNTYGSSFETSGPLLQDRLGMALRGSFNHRQQAELSPSGEFGPNTSISRRGPSPVQSDRWSPGGRLAFAPNRAHDLWLDVDVTRQTYDNSEAQLGTLDDPVAGTFNGYGPEQRFNRDQFLGAHSWRSGRAVLESSLMRNTTETVGRTLPTGTPGGPPGSGAPDKPAGAPRELRSTNTVFDTKATFLLPAHHVSLGGQFWDAEMVDGVALDPFRFTQWSLFAEDEWRIASPLALTVGARWDEHSSFGSHLSPRAYLVWNTTPSWTLKGGVSAGYRTPRVEQLQDGIVGFTGQGTRATIGTPTLKPETSLTTEVGVYYQDPGGFGANVSAFSNAFRDKITSGDPIPNCTFAGAPDLPGCRNYGNFPAQENFSQSVNVDEAQTRGIEAALRFPLGHALALSGNYTFTESEQKSGPNEGFPLSNTPRHMVNGQLRATFSDALSGWVRGEYRSRRTRRTSAGNNAAHDALGDYRAYELFHLGGAWDLGHLTLSVTVYNVLNKDFLEYAAYQGTPSSSNPSGIQYTNLYNLHEEGRRLWISTGFSF